MLAYSSLLVSALDAWYLGNEVLDIFLVFKVGRATASLHDVHACIAQSIFTFVASHSAELKDATALRYARDTRVTAPAATGRFN